jgi:hypothetical protein
MGGTTSCLERVQHTESVTLAGIFYPLRNLLSQGNLGSLRSFAQALMRKFFSRFSKESQQQIDPSPAASFSAKQAFGKTRRTSSFESASPAQTSKNPLAAVDFMTLTALAWSRQVCCTSPHIRNALGNQCCQPGTEKSYGG